jgi:hypothetical protein
MRNKLRRVFMGRAPTAEAPAEMAAEVPATPGVNEAAFHNPLWPDACQHPLQNALLGQHSAPPLWLTNQLQQAQHQWAQQPQPRVLYAVDMTQECAKVALTRLAEALPMRLVMEIKSAAFVADPDGRDGCYVIEFRNGGRIEFRNLEDFPTAADIAQIAIQA